MLACMVGNHGYVPLVLLPAVMQQGVLYAGAGADALEAQTKRGVAFISLFILVINVVTWTAGMRIIRSARDCGDAERSDATAVEASGVVVIAAPSIHSGHGSAESNAAGLSAEARGQAPAGTAEAAVPLAVLPTALNDDSEAAWRQRGSVATGAPPTGAFAAAAAAAGAAAPSESHIRTAGSPTLAKWEARLARVLPAAVSARLAPAADFTAAVLTPPVAASFVGLVVGLVAPVKALLFAPADDDIAAIAAGAYAYPDGASSGANAAGDGSLASFAAVIAASGSTLSPASLTNGSHAAAAILSVAFNGTSWLVCYLADAAAPPAMALVPTCVSGATAALALANDTAAASDPPPADLLASATAPLALTLTAALQALAGAVAPIVALSLGSAMCAPPETATSASASHDHQKQLAGIAATRVTLRPVPTIRWPVQLGVSAVRLVLMPLVGIACVVAGRGTGLLPADQTLLFVLLLQASTPPAMNLQVICDILGSGSAQMARLILVSYCASIITLATWITVYLTVLSGGTI
jgi:predicted permease